MWSPGFCIGYAGSTAAPGAGRAAVELPADMANAPSRASARPAQMPTRLRFPPRLSDRRGERETAREYRIGFSTSLYVSQAGITEATATASVTLSDNPLQWPVAIMSIGQ